MNWLLAPQNDYRSAETGDPSSLTVAIVIPVYNRVNLLDRTLAGLVAQTHPSVVIVADDGSDEDISTVVATYKYRLDLQLLKQDHDGYGAGRARNMGAAAATADVLIFIDADCIPHPNLVANHARHHVLHSNLAVIGARRHIRSSKIPLEEISQGIVDFDAEELASGDRPTDFRQKLGRRTTNNTVGTEAFRFLVSSNFSVRKTMFERVGGFSEDFHRWGGEDTELGWRLSEAGLLILVDEEATIFHQTDLEGPEGWRKEQVNLNQGLIQSKIPHRFFRRPNAHTGIAEVPKLSVILSPVPAKNLQAVIESMLAHTTTDVEIIAHADPDDHEPFAGSIEFDPRISFASGDLSEVFATARGELLVRAHGSAILDRRLLGRLAKVFDDKPTTSSTTVAAKVAVNGSWLFYTQEQDTIALQESWGDPLPLCFGIRRRDWNKCVGAGLDVIGAWETIRSWNRPHHMTTPLFSLPSTVASGRQEVLDPHKANRPLRRLIGDIERGGLRSAVAATRAYRASKAAATEARDSTPGIPLPRNPVGANISGRYVGWTGHDNLGDEALLQTIRTAMPWADLKLSGHPGNLLILGGGTLINRPGYLQILNEYNSPRLERAVFGTGVSNPEFWGKDTDREQWHNYLKSCSYVGLRGPHSVRTLESWGFDGNAEVVGDPALLFERPTVAIRQQGSVVLSPVWTRDNLWGKSDQAVFDQMSRWVNQWLSEGREVTLLACSPDDDRPILNIMRQAPTTNLNYVAGYLDTQSALLALAQAEVVIGERLHACVLAAAVGTPFVGLEYRPKLRDFAASLGVERLLMRTDSLDHEQMDELISLATQSDTVNAVRRQVLECKVRLTEGAEQIRKSVL